MKIPTGKSHTSFRHRVRVVVEVINEPDEISLATALFQDRGWPVRPARRDEVHAPASPRRSLLVVEYRFNGYAKAAPQAAVNRILEAAHQSDLWLQVQYAQVIDPSIEPVRVYYIDEAAPPWAAGHRVIQRALRLLGVIRTTGLVHFPTSLDRTHDPTELARIRLGRLFDPSRSVLRPAEPYREPGPASSDAPLKSTSIVVVSIVAIILAAFCGVAATWTQGIWRISLILLGFFVGPLIGLVFAQRLRFPWWLLEGLTLSFVLTAVGVVWGFQEPVRSPLSFLARTAVVLALLVVGRGVLFAFRESGLVGERSWLLPLAVTALAPVLLPLGGLFDDEYLSHFGIPSGTVSIPGAFRLAIALKAALLAATFVYLGTGIAGWMRYFHAFNEVTRATLTTIFAAVLILYLVTSIAIGLSIVDGAAHDAASQVRAGRSPAGYFGLQGTMQCIRPISSSISEYNGPLPSRRPVLSFGTNTTELWVWDPVSGRTIGMALQDITTTPAAGTPAHC